MGEMDDFSVLEEHRNPNVYAMSSLCEDGNHVIFWDFDINKEPKNLNRIENILKGVQRIFIISRIYIFESRIGYNAVCLDKLDKSTVANIKDLTPCDDKKHLQQGLLYNWKLRIGKDKKFVSGVDVAGFKNYTQSNSHRLALNNFFGTNIEFNRYFDDSRNMCFYSYWDWKEAYNKGELNCVRNKQNI